ncbi:MAG: aminotransferase class V-fold PLP-dependent enzyme [Acidobacteria bacterium]|nr:aminotransferase class V-fold PLP-dependent enzyme [Acidobacteriota bacterium]
MPIPIPNRDKFPQTRDYTYLNTAAEGLLSTDTQEALAEYVRAKARGSVNRPKLYEVEAATIDLATKFLGVPEGSVTFLANATEALNLLANSLDWREGDEVVITDLEFPSNVVTWLRLANKGVRLHVVNADGGLIRLDDITSRITSRTKLVSVSQVSYKSGTQLPYLKQLGEEAHRAGALFCVDATQALGRVPVGVDNVDYLVASSYKWLFTPHGLGITYCSPDLLERLTPATAGWYGVPDIFTPDRFERFEYKPGAARFAAGMPNFSSIYALRASLTYLSEIGVARLDDSLRPIVQKMRGGLADIGLKLLTPDDPAYHSGIVAFLHPQAAEIGEKLAEQDIIVWANDGRVRSAVHLYNEEFEVDRYLEAVAKIVERKPVSATS